MSNELYKIFMKLEFCYERVERIPSTHMLLPREATLYNVNVGSF